jgi:ribonucleoside-diphosphate reductase alpha chain
MNYLSTIVNNQEKISLQYRADTSLAQIKQDLLELDFSLVTNPHLYNLRSVLFPTQKTVVSISASGKRLTGDLEISDDSHSYFVNGIPTHNTINLPNDYPFEDFQNIYLDAYKTGFLKGATTYRAGSMTSVLSAVDQKDESDEEIILSEAKLPDSMTAETKVLRDHESGARKWYVTVNLNENKAPVALFVQTNAPEKSVTTNDALDRLIALARVKGIPEQFITSTIQKCHNDSNVVKIARTIGLLLRHGVRIKNIVSVIDKVEGVTFASFLFHLKKLLSGYIRDGEVVDGEKCSQCGGKLIFESGCQKCLNCGGSKCS